MAGSPYVRLGGGLAGRWKGLARVGNITRPPRGRRFRPRAGSPDTIYFSLLAAGSPLHVRPLERQEQRQRRHTHVKASQPNASARRPDDKITPMARKKRKDPAAVSLGRRGGKAAAGRAQAARWAGTTAAERKKIMRKVIEARWGKKRKTT